MDIQEVKTQIDGLGRAWEEFKSANDARLKEVEKKGSADVLFEEKLGKISKHMDEAQDRIQKLEAAASRTGITSVSPEEKASSVRAEFKRAVNDFSRAKIMPDTSLADFVKQNEEKYSLLSMEQKTLSVGSDPDGGYLVMPQFGGIIEGQVYETSDVRRYASVITIGTDSYELINDDDQITSGGWTGETGQVSNTATPQINKINIPTHEQYAQPLATQKMLDDGSIDVEAWLTGKIAEKFARDENTSFVTGNGVTRPRGFMSYDAASDSGTYEYGKIGQVNSGSASALTAEGLISLQAALKDVYRRNSTWFMNRATRAVIRKLKDGVSNYLWQPGLQAGEPDTLLGSAVAAFEDMANIAANSLPIAYGDLRTAYQIVDRIGIRILRDPYTSKPYVKFYATKRVGGGVVNFDALKIQKVAS